MLHLPGFPQYGSPSGQPRKLRRLQRLRRQSSIPLRLWTVAAVSLLLLALELWPSPCSADPFADAVIEFHPGDGAGFGAGYYPGNVLGPPNGNSDPTSPNSAPQDLLSLGDGGWIVLRFTDNQLVDGPGADLAVFENPVEPIVYPGRSFAETAVVAVSENGTSWTTFPFDFIPALTEDDLLDKSHHVGLAGVNSVFSSPSNGISALDPAVSGGDFFDLAQIGVLRANYVRITDTGTTGATQTTDGDGDIVDDPGNHFAFPGAGSVGFDLDAVAALNSVAAAPARREWTLYE